MINGIWVDEYIDIGAEMSKPVNKKDFQLKELKSGALKHLENKPRVELVPSEMIEALSRPLTYGATKYSDFNWEKGIPFLTSYAAAMRHLLAWRKGVDIDEESGLRHIDQAMLNLGMIVTQTERKRNDLDDRPKKG